MSRFAALSTSYRLGMCGLAPLVVLAATVILPLPAQASSGEVLSHQKISSTEGGFSGVLDDGDFMGVHITTIGDFDGDEVVDIAVGAARDDDGGLDRGAVWIMFLNSDGTVKDQRKISDTAGDFTGVFG